MLFWKNNLVLSCISIIITLIIIEFGLQIVRLVSPDIDYILSRDQPRVIPDDRLGVRPHPLYPEHDQNGFRNKFVPDKTCIVTLGDSQTYGHKVLPEQAWPKQLAQLANIETYNMAYSGWGPVHSLILWEEALELKPSLIIEAFYAGNDLYDAYDRVYNHDQFPNLKSTNETIVEAVMNSGEFRFASSPTNSVVTLQPEKPEGVREYLAEHSSLYGLFRAVKRAYIYNYTQRNTIYFATDWNAIVQLAQNDEDFWVFDNGKARTVFTPKTRLVALDLEDPRMAEGRRISLEVFRIMNEKAQASNIAFVVLLIPTKEFAFEDVVYADSSEVPETYQALIEKERLFWQETKEYLDNQGIYFIDALPALRESIQAGAQPYPISANGHKNSVGQRVVAELVHSKLAADFKRTLALCSNHRQSQ